MCNCSNEIDLGFTHERFPQGTHMCYIYSDDEERQAIISKFLEAGLKDNERVAYFAHSASREDIKKSLEEHGADISNHEQNLIVTRAHETYCPTGEFVIDTMVETLKAFYHGSRKEGFSGARASGEMAWALEGFPGTEKLMEYESMGDIVLPLNPVTVICQYDARKFDGITLLNCLKVHPYMIVKGQVVQNPYYLSHEEFMAEFENK